MSDQMRGYHAEVWDWDSPANVEGELAPMGSAPGGFAPGGF